MKSSSLPSSELPPYASDDLIPSEMPEKTSTSNKNACHLHAAAPTPRLDAHLRQASTKARIEALRSALADIVDDDRCLKCATEAAAQSLFSYLRDLREAKQNGEYSTVEKKALKKEVKGLAKGVKKDIKLIRKTKA